MVVTLIVYYILIYSKSSRDNFPTNYFLLFVFTLGESVSISFITYNKQPMVVLEAAVLTLCIALGLTLYAIKTKTDFTMMGGFLFIAGFAFVGAMMLRLVFHSKTYNLMIETIGVILFGLYLVFDTQIILGNHWVSFGVDEYILAAMMIYLDLINIFIELLQILSEK